jgi:hypothetical protein
MNAGRRCSLFLPGFAATLMLVAGCATTTGVRPKPAQTPTEKCAEASNSVSVIIDARSEGTLRASLPKTHEVEVCKGKQSLVWFASHGSDMRVELDRDKDASIPEPNRGRAADKPRCGDVKAKDGTLLGAVCFITIHGTDDSGRIPYTLTVTPEKGSGPNPVPIDPQMIIRP